MRGNAQSAYIMDQMAAEQPKELSGWKAIASHLGVSVRTAQDYERILGLPVHRQPGEKGRVFADPDELDGWRKQTGGNGVSALNEDAAAGVAQRPVPVRKIWRRAFILAVVAAAPLLALGAYLLVIPHGPPSDFRVEGKNLIVVNDRGKELWRHTFEVALREDQYLPANKVRLSWFGPLDGDGQPDLLFATKPVNEDGMGGRLICLAADGKIQWQFTPGRPVTDAGGERMVPPYMMAALQVIVGKTPADTRIVVSSIHYRDQPDQVAFLNVHGRVIGEYWHPGHLTCLGAADLDNDGQMDMLLAGVNNGNHQATLVVLDPLKVVGALTPKEMKDHRFELLGMPSAREKAVVFFPRSSFSAGQPYTRTRRLSVTKERVIVLVAEGVRFEDPTLIYELDYRLNVINVTPAGAEVNYAYRALEARGAVDHSFSEECARLKAGVIVRRER